MKLVQPLSLELVKMDLIEKSSPMYLKINLKDLVANASGFIRVMPAH